MALSAGRRLVDGAKVGFLAAVVIGAFLFSSLTWRHIETSRSSRALVAGAILVAMYAYMIFELVNRNLAALVGAAVSVAAHDCLVSYVELAELVKWLDVETLALLLGMMIMVNVLGQSGLFDYLAVWCYQKSGGRFWSLLFVLAAITAILSAFMDNVSTMLLMAPTLVRLSELEHIDPRPVLIIMVLFSNIGGTATPVGDPPNLIIIGSPLVASLGVTFSVFVAYCVPCVLLTMLVVMIYLKWRYQGKQSFRLADSKRGEPHLELEARAPHKLDLCLEEKRQLLLGLLGQLKSALAEQGASLEVAKLQQQIGQLEAELAIGGAASQPPDEAEECSRQQRKLAGPASLEVVFTRGGGDGRRSSRLTEAQIGELLRTHSIKSRPILILSLSVLTASIVLFFVQSLPGTRLTLGWISLFGALTLLVAISSVARPASAEEEEHEHEDNFELAIRQVEWSTLMFFAALFIMMEAMAKLGLIQLLGEHIAHLLGLLPEGALRQVGAISLMLWSSALASALVDNVPFASMMIKVIAAISAPGNAAGLPVKALVFALAFGVCYGGNGTLIGASANLVTAGQAARHNYPISFCGFASFAAPVALISLVVANVYLVVVFVWLAY